MNNSSVKSKELLKFIINQALLVSERLERLSVDSIWAHRASGCRGSLLRLITIYMEGSFGEDEFHMIKRHIDYGYLILDHAAKDLL